MAKNVFPIFFTKSTLMLCGISVIKLQILIMSGFLVTNYKILQALFWIAMPNLNKKSNSISKDLYKKFCCTYVQLLHLQKLDGI